MLDVCNLYGSGLAHLDRDHALLIKLLSTLKSSDLDQEAVAGVSRELLAYLDAHFEHEDLLMDRYSYPEAAAHKEAHRRMLAETEELVRICDTTGSPAAELIRSLEGWAVSHMCEMDHRLAEFLPRHSAELPGDNTGFFSEPVPAAE